MVYDAMSCATPRGARAPSRLIAPCTIVRICSCVNGEKKISAQRERIAGSMSSGSRVVAPIRMKSAGRALAEQPLHVLGNVRRALVVVRRLEHHALVFEYLEQPRLQRRIHLADLVDEEHAAVGSRHQPELWLGHAGVGELALASLIDGVVDAA